MRSGLLEIAMARLGCSSWHIFSLYTYIYLLRGGFMEDLSIAILICLPLLLWCFVSLLSRSPEDGDFIL